jgi:Leucine-rich repeat (LRR) protein
MFEDEDERRNFFIQSSKKSKIAKRLSFIVDISTRHELCPPNYSDIQHLKEVSHLPIKLTQLNLRRPRIEEILLEYKSKQVVREERLHKERRYKNC